MALSFFRRRQKMVVIIMAFLMVSFLVGSQLSEMVRGCHSGENVIGTALGSDVTRKQLESARFEMQHLRNNVGVGNPYRNRGAELTGPVMEMHAAMAFLNGIQNTTDQALAFLLLAREATKADVSVSEGEVDTFLAGLGLDVQGQQYSTRLANLVEDGVHEEQFRGLVTKWLRIWKTFNASTVDTPPSMAELKLFYRDLNEGIKLRILRVSAEDMLKDVKTVPSQQRILDQFEKFKNTPIGRFTSTDSFGFAYRQPNRVSIGYLLVDGAVVRRVTRPSDRQARDYWNDGQREFYKQVAIPTLAPASEPATSQASQPASAPAAPPVEYKQELITEVAEAMPQIRDILTASMTESRMDSVANLAQARLGKVVRDGVSSDKDYEQLLAGMTLSADGVLDRILKDVDINAETLDKAVAKIAAAARLDAICYPWGSHGFYNLSPDILVTLQPKAAITLRDALNEITDQVFGRQMTATTEPSDSDTKSLKLKWAMCAGFDDVLFPLGGDIEMFPLKIGSTSLMTMQELQDHEMLAFCSTSTARRGGKRLVDMAFQVGEFLGKDSRRAALYAGKDGSRMILLGARRGRVLWRPLQAIAAHVPTKLTPELRKQIINDLQIRDAYDLAEGKVQSILAVAREKGLAAAAKEQKMETFDTEMFARKTIVSPRWLYRYQLSQKYRPLDAWMLAMTVQPIAFMSSRVSGVDLPATPKYGQDFMEQVFSLTPDDIDKPIDPASKPAVTVFLLPVKRELFVLERIGYEPAVAADFQEEGRGRISDQLADFQRWKSMSLWFNVAELKKRTDFVLKRD